MKIGVMGTHRVGKTWFVNNLVADLRERKNRDVVVLEEGARVCPYPVNRHMTLQSQKWLLAHQISMEHTMDGFAGIVVCDRTVLDPVIYALWLEHHTRANKELKRFTENALPFALDWLSDEYDRVYWLRAHGRPITADGFADTDPVFQEQIDKLFERVVKGHGVDCREI